MWYGPVSNSLFGRAGIVSKRLNGSTCFSAQTYSTLSYKEIWVSPKVRVWVFSSPTLSQIPNLADFGFFLSRNVDHCKCCQLTVVSLLHWASTIVYNHGWQVSAVNGLSRGLNRFKSSWQKQFSVRVLPKHIKCSNFIDKPTHFIQNRLKRDTICSIQSGLT